MTLGWQYPQEVLDRSVLLVPPDPEEGGGELQSDLGYRSSYVMLGYMPEFYGEDPVIRSVLSSIGLEVDLVRATLDSILEAQFVASAPEWAIRLWEFDTGNPVAPDGVSVANRREQVLANVGFGPRTVSDFGSLIEGFFGSVDYAVVEDFAGYGVEFSIYSNQTAEEQAAFEALVRRMVPAHLTVSFQYGTFVAGDAKAGDSL